MNKIYKKLMNMVLGLILAVSLIPQNFMVQQVRAVTSPVGNWQDTGNYSITWYGDGSASTFTIADAADLAGLANLVNAGINDFSGKTIILENNVDLSAHYWTTIGLIPTNSNPNRSFNGTFNGNNRTISHLNINNPQFDNCTGLFCYTETSANILNTRIINAVVNGGNNVGGLVGQNLGSIANSYVDGTVTGKSYAGGLVGYSGGSVTNSFASGTVTINPYCLDQGPMGILCYQGDVAGGLVGRSEGSITNSYSTATIAGRDSLGGLVGVNGGTITNSYATGSVAGDYFVGGLIGNTADGTVTNSFWDTQTSGQSSGQFSIVAGIGKTTNEMKQQATFTGWDFSVGGVWSIKSGAEISYPYLQSNSQVPVPGLEVTYQVRWGVAGVDGSTPTTWVGSGTVTDALIYANTLGVGTAYLQLGKDIDKNNHTTWPLVFDSGKTTILDLNGKVINRGLTTKVNSGNVITVNGRLTLTDSSTSTVADQGIITGGFSASSTGGGIFVPGTLIMLGGNITGNKSTASSQGGGGVFVYTNGNFEMKSGSITNNEALYWGGGVYAYGTFKVTGGRITGNRSANGGVFFDGSFIVGGTPVIEDNTTTGTTPVERNVVRLSYVITIDPSLTSGARIGVTANSQPSVNNPINITGNNTSDYSSYFFSDNDVYRIKNSGSGSKQIIQLEDPRANLSSLNLSSGTLIPTFASGTTSYSVNLGNEVSSITVNPTVFDANATVTVNGTSVTSGTNSAHISLNVGVNTILVVVTSPDTTSTKTYTLTVTRAKPKVTFETNGGTWISPITADYGAMITAPAAPSKTGYTFGGWYKEEGLTNAFNFASEQITADTTLYARWTVNNYTLTYNLDGGTNGSNPTTYTIETATIALANGTKTGYTFKGWFDALIGGNQVTQIALGSTGNKTLYARWTANTDTAYKVEHYQQDVSGSGYTLKETENLTGTTASTANAVAKTYTGFIENQANLSRIGSGSIAADGSLVLKLYYDRNEYTLTFNGDGGSKVTAITQDFGTEVTAPANPTKVGYTFTGWNPAVPETMPASNMTLVASYSKNTSTAYIVEHYQENLGGGYTLFETENLSGTTDLPVTAFTKAYTGFSENTSFPERVASATIQANGSTALRLYYDRNRYTVTFRDYDDTNLKIQIVKYQGNAYAPESPTREGYTFNGWDKKLSNISSNLMIDALYTKLNDPKVEIVQNDQVVSVNAEGLVDAIGFSDKDRLEDISIKLKISVVDENKVPITDKSFLDNYISNTLKVDNPGLLVMDISLFKVVGGKETAITNTDNEITVKFILPDAFRNADFRILRVHNGIVETLEHTLNKESFEVTFKTDKFSTYGVVTLNSVTSSLQNNGFMGLATGLFLGLGLTIGGIWFLLWKKKKEEKEVDQ